MARDKEEISILPEYHQAMLLMAGLLWEKGERDSAQRLAERSLLWGRKNAVFPVVCHALELQTGWSRSVGTHEKALETFSMLAQYLEAEQKSHLAEQEKLLREKDVENLQLDMQLKE